MQNTNREDIPCVMALFGASGDVTRRKLMPAIFRLWRDGELSETFAVVGFGRSPKTDDVFREEMRQGVREHSDLTVSHDEWTKFSSRLHYVTGHYDSVRDMEDFHRHLTGIDGSGTNRPVLYYLALPPSAAEQVLRTMTEAIPVPNDGSRIMMEKPFGLDVVGAQRMNALLSELFPEERIYRVDHFLAKDIVRGLVAFRFANTIWEPLWNRNYIDHVQITAAENIGIEGRGGYYDETGVIRDMLQNHVLQVLALIAMEPPLARDVESFRFRKVEVFKSIEPLRQEDFVLGQYDGYRTEANVSSVSPTPTYAAARLFIANWRWQGVPFYVRSGKALARKTTEIAIQFKSLPFCILEQCSRTCTASSNVLFIRIQPTEGMTLQFNIRGPGHEDRMESARLDFHYTSMAGQPVEAYESVILDALLGRPTLFWRGDGIEAAWKIVAPMLVEDASNGKTYPNYARSSWGPPSADQLLLRDGRHWLSSTETG